MGKLMAPVANQMQSPAADILRPCAPVRGADRLCRAESTPLLCKGHASQARAGPGLLESDGAFNRGQAR
jgi:hypothetical protein